MYMNIDVYKCIVNERLEKIKNETYGEKAYNKNRRTMNWKVSLNMILNVFL